MRDSPPLVRVLIAKVVDRKFYSLLIPTDALPVALRDHWIVLGIDPEDEKNLNEWKQRT